MVSVSAGVKGAKVDVPDRVKACRALPGDNGIIAEVANSGNRIQAGVIYIRDDVLVNSAIVLQQCTINRRVGVNGACRVN